MRGAVGDAEAESYSAPDDRAEQTAENKRKRLFLGNIDEFAVRDKFVADIVGNGEHAEQENRYRHNKIDKRSDQDSRARLDGARNDGGGDGVGAVVDSHIKRICQYEDENRYRVSAHIPPAFRKLPRTCAGDNMIQHYPVFCKSRKENFYFSESG